MTALLQEPLTQQPVDAASVRFASWGARLGAFALDYLPGVAVLTTMGLMWFTAPHQGWLWWVYTATAVLTIVAMGLNRVALPNITGWTLGRAVFGIQVVRANGQPPGILRMLLREFAHLLDTAAAFIGWLWPLWDAHHRTFADLLVRTEVRVVERPRRNVRRLAACVLAAAALLCAAGAGLGYVAVYRHDQAVDQARSELAEQGPRIVEQLLSYSAEKVVDDFANAQGLATDSYRPQLIAQQQAVQKAGVTSNEYWAVSSAVLSVEPDRAAMLMALQGQRGANANELKFITATVRADFEKVGGQWRVSNLTVLKKPLGMGSAQ